MISSTSDTSRRPYQTPSGYTIRIGPWWCCWLHPIRVVRTQVSSQPLDLVAEPLEDVLRALTPAVVATDGGADKDVDVAVRLLAHHPMVAHAATAPPGPACTVPAHGPQLRVLRRQRRGATRRQGLRARRGVQRPLDGALPAGRRLPWWPGFASTPPMRSGAPGRASPDRCPGQAGARAGHPAVPGCGGGAGAGAGGEHLDGHGAAAHVRRTRAVHRGVLERRQPDRGGQPQRRGAQATGAGPAERPN